LSNSFELKKLIFVATDSVLFVSLSLRGINTHTHTHINFAQVELENVELRNTPFVAPENSSIPAD